MLSLFILSKLILKNIPGSLSHGLRQRRQRDWSWFKGTWATFSYNLIVPLTPAGAQPLLYCFHWWQIAAVRPTFWVGGPTTPRLLRKAQASWPLDSPWLGVQSLPKPKSKPELFLERRVVFSEEGMDRLHSPSVWHGDFPPWFAINAAAIRWPLPQPLSDCKCTRDLEPESLWDVMIIHDSSAAITDHISPLAGSLHPLGLLQSGVQFHSEGDFQNTHVTVPLSVASCCSQDQAEVFRGPCHLPASPSCCPPHFTRFCAHDPGSGLINPAPDSGQGCLPTFPTLYLTHSYSSVNEKAISWSKKEMENFIWAKLRIITQEQQLRTKCISILYTLLPLKTRLAFSLHIEMFPW